MPSETIERAASAVPALVQTPALEIDAGDVALPALKIAHFQSKAVTNELISPGSLYTSLGEDDPDPVELWKLPKGNAKGEAPLRFHVLGMRKGLSHSEQGGELEMWQFGDPSAHPDAWTTYNYFICLPEIDENVPYKFLLTKTKAQAAKQINFALMSAAPKGPAYINAFTVKTAPRENTKGKYFIPMISVVEAEEAHIKMAESMAIMVSGRSAEVQATGEEPAI